MRRVERLNESLFGIENSTVDPNRFYSILLDARAASVSENMCDIAEKLLSGEKENAKGALEHLWRLKKNLFSGRNNTIDLLINYYQEKMDILRGKEEHLKKVTTEIDPTDSAAKLALAKIYRFSNREDEAVKTLEGHGFKVTA